MRALAILAALLPGAALAEPPFTTLTYTCERGVTVPVTYVNTGDTALAVLNVEGRQVTLLAERAASGARYGWPSDGAHYVWWSKGDGAVLLWHGPDGTEDVLLASCTAT
ncbi:MliC family protein [Falsirhodobacter algicola]|uniref:Lysozyme inhibitor n=1 Tax=Falsirhodobacter algicola TaxID=2692330 RepID=A0A8J8MS74_9RHOB|nr:MliC family protein [Falsirhodobacter algicola]QUS35731.1 lysozyme inhibitor [Falsirhodobacter algicola]